MNSPVRIPLYPLRQFTTAHGKATPRIEHALDSVSCVLKDDFNAGLNGNKIAARIWMHVEADDVLGLQRPQHLGKKVRRLRPGSYSKPNTLDRRKS